MSGSPAVPVKLPIALFPSPLSADPGAATKSLAEARTPPGIRTQRKIIAAENAIYFQPHPEFDELTFSARELVQATLPH